MSVNVQNAGGTAGRRLVSYHILIMIEAGLIEGLVSKEIGNANPGARATRLTWSGHEFIEAARDDTRWNKAMNMAKEKAGSVTLSVLTQLLNALMAKAVGLS